MHHEVQKAGNIRLKGVGLGVWRVDARRHYKNPHQLKEQRLDDPAQPLISRREREDSSRDDSREQSKTKIGRWKQSFTPAMRRLETRPGPPGSQGLGG
jgi:hypothetical protein